MGDSGQIYVLDMGKPVRIAELARDIIRLSGFNEDTVRIEYTGLRPGEKLFEEVIDAAERMIETPHPKLQIAEARAVEGATSRGSHAGNRSDCSYFR